MKATKTLKKSSSMSFGQNFSSFRVMDSFLCKHSKVYLDDDFLGFVESFSQRSLCYGYIVTLSSYAQAANKSISQAASDIMELVNDGDLKYETTVGFIHYFKWSHNNPETYEDYDVEPTPASLMADLNELKKVDSISECNNIKFETSIDEYLSDNLGSTYRLSRSPKERKIIILDLMMALFNEIKLNREGQDTDHLIEKIKELNFCYNSIIEMNKEIRKHRSSNSRSQNCYAYYDLKQYPPKLIGLGITAGDPFAFIKKTLRFGGGLMRQFELEFDVRPVDDNKVIGEINRLIKEYKPYTKFLLSYKGDFYACDRFSAFIRGIEAADKTSSLARMAPVKVKTQLLKARDHVWKWENKPRVIGHNMDLWNTQSEQDASNPYTSHYRYSDEEIKALNENFFIISKDMEFSDFPNNKGIEIKDVFKDCSYSFENGVHVIRYSREGNSLELRVSKLETIVSTFLITENGRKEVSARVNYSNKEVNPEKVIYWIELYEMVKIFISSPSPLNLSCDIYAQPGEKPTERDVLEAILKYKFSFNVSNFSRPFFFNVEMID